MRQRKSLDLGALGVGRAVGDQRDSSIASRAPGRRVSPSPGTDNLKDRAVWTIEMLPAVTVRVLNVTYELDTSRKHCSAS
jgi:hypothetical protein